MQERVYKDYVSYSLEKAAIEGLGYVFGQLFSVIPAALGHTLDTLLRLDGLFLDKNSHFNAISTGRY